MFSIFFAKSIYWILYSYLSWVNLDYYLNDFIYVLAADLATSQQFQDKNKAYQLFTNYIDIPHQEVKDIEDTFVLVFELKIDIENFINCILPNKIARAQEITNLALKQSFFTRKKAQSLIKFLSFYT